MYWWQCTAEVTTGICCYFMFGFIVDGFFGNLGKVFNCLMLFVFYSCYPECLSFLGFLNTYFGGSL